MKYAVSLGDGCYARKVAWFSETLPVVTLKDSRIENAALFEDKELEEVFKKSYQNSSFVPVYFKIGNA